eukprot:6972249-Prymnesium_polylepis.1
MARQRVQLLDRDGASPHHSTPGSASQARAPPRRCSCGTVLPVQVELRDAPNAVEPMLGALARVALERENQHARVMKIGRAAHHLL